VTHFAGRERVRKVFLQLLLILKHFITGIFIILAEKRRKLKAFKSKDLLIYDILRLSRAG
jgi:hypothetical protein